MDELSRTDKIKKWISHYPSTAISMVLVCLALLWFFGCDSHTQSLIDPLIKVTEAQLDIEYTSELARLEAELIALKRSTEVRLQDLHRQDKMKQALFENAKLVASSNNPNPIGILSLIGTLFGIGAVIDNRRKDGIITAYKSTGA